MIKVNSAGTRTILHSCYVGGVFSYHERKFYGRGRVSYVWATCIDGVAVEFEMNPDYSGGVGVHFKVGGSYDKEVRGSRIRISKWLMAVWEEAKALGISRYSASAHATDGHGDYRVKLYSKFGWKVDEDASYMDEDGPVIALVYS